jgi:hypothetical protein
MVFDSSKNVLFKEERHYRYLKLFFLIFGLVIAYPIYIIFSGVSIYGYSLPIGINRISPERLVEGR